MCPRSLRLVYTRLQVEPVIIQLPPSIQLMIGLFGQCNRLSSGAMLGQPMIIRDGTVQIDPRAPGDYSATTLDPTDDWNFWTVQAYASTSFGTSWRTVVAKIRPIP